MYPVVDAIHPDERHAIDLLITSKRFKNKLKGLDSNVNRPRSERIPHMKRGGYDRRRR